MMTDLPKTREIELQLDENWLTIWLNRPEARNALSAEMCEELFAALGAVRDDRSVRGITFRGRGGIFCAGGDIKGFKAIFQGEAGNKDEVSTANQMGGKLFAMINEMPQIVVMLVEGAAIAGGMGMACAGDVVIVTKDAKFALTETTLGIPPAQIAPFIVQRLGLSQARRLMLTAARFDGAQALELGLANEVVDEPGDLEVAEAVIRNQVRNCAPGAVAATKEILLATRQLDQAALRKFAGDKFAECMLGEEGLEGVSAFIEKRKPSWNE